MESESQGGVIMYSPDLLLHDPLVTGPEGTRLQLIIEELVNAGMWPDQIHEADIATMKRLREIHDPEYLDLLHKRCTHGVGSLDQETPVMEKSFEVARFGAGGVLDAIDLIMDGKIPNAACLTAMPGHHAGYKKFGFGSMLNYAAAGAHYLSKKFSLKRVAIVDLDADHGVGTQEIFWERRDVLTVSLHEYPGRTGTGHYSETGKQPASGYNVNIPLPSGYGDREYLVCWREMIVPMLKQYEPEFLIVPWGTNVLTEEGGTHLLVSQHGLLALFREVFATARQLCKGKIVTILEGGVPGRAQATAFANHAQLLINNRLLPVDKGKKEEIISYSDWYAYAKLLKANFRKYWKV
ncbi:MAG: Acetoin utilization protein AcuC [bacterium ADurb.Bin374]|nr:MAG: Acetoin utilization protein AcuC [bacterium ADurb.Bin374]